MNHALRSERAFLVVMALAFVASAAATISGYQAMSTMHGMEMPGGWTMSMTWMRMPDQSWPGAVAAFTGMWVVMMVAMMLPAITPAIARCRHAMRPLVGARLGQFTFLVAAGYFTMWALAGLAAFPVGVVLARLAMNLPAVSHAVPLATALTLVIAGALQFTAWKSRQLHCCRAAPLHAPGNARAAWRYGLRLGIRCIHCCAGLTATLMVLGVMDLRAMVIVTVAITAERWSSASERIARVTGALAIVAGLIQLSRI